jgi:hypothetical protein
MKQVKKIFAVTRLVIPAALAAIVALLLAACAPAVEPAGGLPPLPAGKGIVNIQLGVNDTSAGPAASLARTLLPTVDPSNFDSYDLTFTPAVGAPVVLKDITYTGLTGIELNAETYTLVLKAYKGTELAAEGTVTGIEVKEEETATPTVPLTFKPTDTDKTGTLNVTVTNSSGLTLTKAEVGWTPLNGGTTEGTETIVPGTLKDITLNAGYYVVTVTLSTDERTATRTDVAHIGVGQTTPLTWEFTEGDFSTVVEAIWLVGLKSPWTLPGTPMTAEDNGTFTWQGEVSGDKGFRFSLLDSSGWTDNNWGGHWFAPANPVNSVAVGDYGFSYYHYADPGTNQWTLTDDGYYRFVVDPHAKNLTVSKPTIVNHVYIKKADNEEITTISLPQGTVDYQFTVRIDGYNANQGVTWAISSGTVTGVTAITSDGKLTIDDDETPATMFTITATSVDDPLKSGSVTVTVDSKTAQALSPPTNVTLSNEGVATWEAPSGGETGVVSYSVQLYKGMDPLGDAEPVNQGLAYSVDFLEAMQDEGNGSYTVKVKAVGNGIAYSDSPEVQSGSQTVSTKPTVSNLWWVDQSGEARWVNPDGDSNFIVQLYKNGSKDGEPVSVDRESTNNGGIETRTHKDFSTSITATGTYTFKVITKGDGKLVLDSPESAAPEVDYDYVATLPAPAKPTLSTGVVSWGTVTGAASYTVKLYKSGAGEAVGTYEDQTSGNSILDYMRSNGAGSYTVTVTAIGNSTDWLTSVESSTSDSETVAVLGTPSDLAWSETNATWTEVANASSYTVTLYKGGVLEDTFTGASSPKDLAANLTSVGYYTFTVQAIASTTSLYIDSDVSAASSAKQIGGTASITLTASENWSGTLAVTGGSASIARTTGSVSISVSDGSFESFVWIVDGIKLTGQTGASITLYGSNYKLGGHSVTVYAVDDNGTPWSPAAPITFTVTAN